MLVDIVLFATKREEQQMGRKTNPEAYREQIVALARAGRNYSVFILQVASTIPTGWLLNDKSKLV